MKTEVVLQLPPTYYKTDLNDRVLLEMQAFVGEITKQKYIFLSQSESVVIEEGTVAYTQLPPDVDIIYLRIEGHSSFVEVKTRARFKDFNEVRDHNLNQVIIQGANPVAVRGLHSKLQSLIVPNRFVIRGFFYRFPLMWFWSTLVILWFAEYRAVHFVRPSVSLESPLSALGAIFIFAVAFGSALVYGNAVVTIFNYWFPYLEIEGNVAAHRKSFQSIAAAVWSSLIAAGIWNLFGLFRG